jgi:uncharacterized protein YndB with AHSA1/START domain
MTPKTTEPTIVQLSRTIPGPPDRVYRAWLDPKLLRQWLAPRSLTVTQVEVDERIGGHHRIWQANAHGEDVGGFEAELLELVPGERIVFRWGFVGPDRIADPAHESRLTITLRAAPDGGTELTLLHERLEGLAVAMPDVAQNAATGWGMALDKLAATLGQEE